MKSEYQITVEALEIEFRKALTRDGWTEWQAEKFIDAQRRTGFLRRDTPPEMLGIAELFCAIPPASGFGPVIPPIPTPPRPKTRHAPQP